MSARMVCCSLKDADGVPLTLFTIFSQTSGAMSMKDRETRATEPPVRWIQFLVQRSSVTALGSSVLLVLSTAHDSSFVLMFFVVVFLCSIVLGKFSAYHIAPKVNLQPKSIQFYTQQQFSQLEKNGTLVHSLSRKKQNEMEIWMQDSAAMVTKQLLALVVLAKLLTQ